MCFEFSPNQPAQGCLWQLLKEQKGEVVIKKCQMLNAKCKKGEHGGDCYRVVGDHDGVWFYTIGQRSGFRVRQNLLSDAGETVEMIPPFYVIEKDVEKNRLVVGFGPTTLRERFEVGEVNWLVNGTRDSIHPSLKLRMTGALLQNDSVMDRLVKFGEFFGRLQEFDKSGLRTINYKN